MNENLEYTKISKGMRLRVKKNFNKYSTLRYLSSEEKNYGGKIIEVLGTIDLSREHIERYGWIVNHFKIGKKIYYENLDMKCFEKITSYPNLKRIPLYNILYYDEVVLR